MTIGKIEWENFDPELLKIDFQINVRMFDSEDIFDGTADKHNTIF